MPHMALSPIVAGLDDLRVFEKVGSLLSFAAAAKALSQPRSNISRSVARLEDAIGARLFNRTTRKVTLTAAGEVLLARCAAPLDQLGDALAFVGSLATEASGQLRISVGIGFGINVLAEQLPAFLLANSKIDIMLDLTSRVTDLVADRVDVAIRFGSLPDSSIVAVRLGEMKRVLCAAPAYFERHGKPKTIDELARHDTIEMPTADGRARPWKFIGNGETRELTVEPRIFVNDALTIHRLVVNGAGVGIISCYLCSPDIEAGRLMQILPRWTPPAVAVNLVFPSKRELAPAVRAFVDFMKTANTAGKHWQNNNSLKALTL